LVNDAKHKPYVEVAEVYPKLPRVAPVLTHWIKYLYRRRMRTGALELFGQEVASQMKERPSGN
jgi:hypothetical protein